MSKKNTSKAQERRARNWLAVRAFQRSGAGTRRLSKIKMHVEVKRPKEKCDHDHRTMATPYQPI